MSGSRQQALVVARQLVRTFASVPDARRQIEAAVSEFNRLAALAASMHARVIAEILPQ